jgi:CHAD domain-containing protein
LAGVRWGNAFFMAETLEREHSFRLDDALPRNRGPAQRAVADYLSAQIDAIVAGDAGLRYGADPIHDTRVAIRRVRSTLRVFAKLFDDDDGAADALETDLKWFAALLGEVRDCQVQRRRFEHALDELPDELILGPVRSDVRNDLLGVERPARGRVTEAMDSSRYLGMMAVLGRWQTEPPLADGSDVQDLRKCVKKAGRKADSRLRVAVDGSDDVALHSARKAAKRARYAAELLSSVQPKARRKAKAHKRVQGALGDHQDTVVARDVLRRMAAGTGTSQGRNGFTYGLLYAREQRIAQETRLKARKLAKKGQS